MASSMLGAGDTDPSMIVSADRTSESSGGHGQENSLMGCRMTDTK